MSWCPGHISISHYLSRVYHFLGVITLVYDFRGVITRVYFLGICRAYIEHIIISLSVARVYDFKGVITRVYIIHYRTLEKKYM